MLSGLWLLGLPQVVLMQCTMAVDYPPGMILVFWGKACCNGNIWDVFYCKIDMIILPHKKTPTRWSAFLQQVLQQAADVLKKLLGAHLRNEARKPVGLGRQIFHSLSGCAHGSGCLPGHVVDLVNNACHLIAGG